MSIKNQLPNTITVTPNGDEIGSPEVANGIHHFLSASVNVANKDICLNFSTRRAMYDFAVSLLQEAVYGNGGMVNGKGGIKEFLPSNNERWPSPIVTDTPARRILNFQTESG